MVVIHHDPPDLAAAQSIRDTLVAAYDGRLQVALMEAAAAGAWPAEASWDDLLVVPFSDGPLSPASRDFIARQSGPEGGSRPVLPVALSSNHSAPPEPIRHLKALPWNDDAGADARGKLARRVGAMLGLRLRNREQTIFISYRSADGTAAATQLEGFLTERGYRVWRDEARDEFDDEGSIPGGADVQKVIEETLVRADLLLLLDTPQASASRWIRLEVDLANGQLIPVLPLLFVRPGERLRTSRFRALATLQRGCDLKAAADGTVPPLEPAELARVLAEVEDYLADVFRRRLRVPFLVEREFTSRDFAWNKRDGFIYEALRQRRGLLGGTRIFSHCSHFEGIYDPALRALVTHFHGVEPRANYAFYIYDAQQLISEPELEEIRRTAYLDESTTVVILHHQELATVLQKNF